MAPERTRESLLREGETCWRVAHAGRATFLVDGENYFAAVADALENARHSVWLLGWDFHSSVRLRRDANEGRPAALVTLLDGLVRKRSSLHVHVLGWDFAMLYALEREFLPLLQFGAKTHRRIHFAMDSQHPLTASQHQKLVVVDDRIAFVGGFDLTSHRWDTREHAPDDARRVTPAGRAYQPFHDCQIAVDGDAAAALAELARHRWELATGRRVSGGPGPHDPWPDALAADVRDVSIGIARTFPAYHGEPEIREVEALYRASIAAARRWIYIENQYLTSVPIGEWLAERLREADGPEILIVGPQQNSGWLEQNTMGSLRARVVNLLRDADEHGRLRILYPDLPGLPEGHIINIHSKVMVVDDDFVRVGSSNLSNRSMGLDTECDVAFEARGEDRVRQGIAEFRNDLLAEHLDTTPERVAEELARDGSLVGAVDRLVTDGRSLRRLDIEASEWTAEAIDAFGAIDPEHPVPLEELVTCFEENSTPNAAPSSRGLSGLVTISIVAVLLMLTWQVTPLGDWVTGEGLAETLGALRGSWTGPIVALAIFVVASLLLVPVTALTVASGLALGIEVGVAVTWIGCTISAGLGHLAGRYLWRDTVRRIAGERLNALSKRLGRRGILSSALVRVVPVAPFMVVNLVAGASHVRARDFIIGTAVGTLPGAVLLVVAADSATALVAEPNWTSAVWAGVAVLALFGMAQIARRLPWPGATGKTQAGS